MSNEWNWHVNSLQTRLNDLQSTIDSIKSCVERRPGLDAATKAIAALIEASTQSEFALQEFPTALSQILSDPAIGSLLIGPQGEIVLYNSTAEQLLGREYMSDRSTTSIQFSSEDRSKRLVSGELPWNRALQGEALPDVRLHLSRPSNNDVWVNVSATPFRSPQGAVTGAVVFLIDTTEEVALEGSITSLCNTIQDQISQVGSTHTQLRDLADRLSNTGIQRILGDSGPAQAPSGRPEEDPTRKKPHPRRDEGAAPSAARQAELPQAKGQESEPGNRGVIVPPPPPPAKSDRVLIPPPPSPRSTDEVGDAPVAQQPPLPTADTSAYDYDSTESDHESSGSWAQVSISEEDSFSRLPENTNEANPVVLEEGSKTLEVERVEIEPGLAPEAAVEESLHSSPADVYPTESEVSELPDVSLDTTDTQDAVREPVAEAEQPQEVSRWSAEYSEKYEQQPVEEEAAKSDFWVTGQEQPNGDANKATEGDQVVDSAKSLFGKFANLTKDSYGEAKSEDKEPDPALPWPELVDGQDYGEPLWDEYTQSEEETTPWQQDKVDEVGEEPILPAAAQPQAQVEQQEYVEESAAVAEEAEDDSFASLDDDSYAIPQAHSEGEVTHAEPTYEEATEDAPAEQSDFAEESDEFGPIEQQVEEPVAEVVAEVPEVQFDEEPTVEITQEEYAVQPTELVEAHEEVAAQEVYQIQEVQPEAPAAAPAEDQYTTGSNLPKPASLKDQLAKKQRGASASYNRLKPLSAAAELDDMDGGFLNEGLTEQVVRFSAEDAAPVDEGPKRVLVVDDIPVNQKLLLLHLKRLGYEADVASNGQEALDMLAEKAYELILMDCDMPVMSGFEAASRIRSNEAYSHRRIPIIALTSYDREGDKEKCIAAGMDDYITKGASQKELKDTIERSMVSARMKGETETADDLDEADMAPLDITAMLKLYGREEVEEISRLFLSNMGTYIECMQLAIDNKDGDSVAHFANAVKGPCAALGMRLMTRLTSDIMAYAESQDWTQVRVKYMRLKAVFVQTREELKKVCPDDSLLAT